MWVRLTRREPRIASPDLAALSAQTLRASQNVMPVRAASKPV